MCVIDYTLSESSVLSNAGIGIATASSVCFYRGLAFSCKLVRDYLEDRLWACSVDIQTALKPKIAMLDSLKYVYILPFK